MAIDKINWAVAKDGAQGQFPGRFELGFRNLTQQETCQLLMTLDKLQGDRHGKALIAGEITDDDAALPASTARDFAAEHPSDDIYAKVAASLRIGDDEIDRALIYDALVAPYGEPS